MQKDNIYGKLKGSRLIQAPTLFLRDGDIGVQDFELYKSLGYKKVIYQSPPNNQPGYELRSSWDEKDDHIQQTWNFYKIEEDYSSELLCAIRDFNYSIDFIINNIHNLKQENDNEYKKLLKANKILEIIWEKRCMLQAGDTLLDLLHRCKLNLQAFFDSLSITKEIENLGYIICPQYIVQRSEQDEKHILPFTYIKSNLSKIYSLYNFSSLRSKLAYDMAYIYAFTIFDDLLLKFARYICKLERNWLAGNTSLTYKDIVECTSLDEVQQLIIERRIAELSWGSYLDKLSFFNSHGINTDSLDPLLFNETIAFISEKRNVIVHNSGIWNLGAYYKLKTNKHLSLVSVNCPVERTVESIELECGNQLRNAANGLYDLLCLKFSLINRYKAELLESPG